MGVAEKNMPKITFVSPEGTETEVDAPNGISVLEIAHKNNIPLEGACEGSLACSTCHVAGQYYAAAYMWPLTKRII